MISIPVFLLAGGATWLFWRADIRAGVLISALVCGYAMATSPLAGAIDGLGNGISVAVQNAGNDQAASSHR
ncbi:hypothetical protein [Streptomyces sp. 900105245]